MPSEPFYVAVSKFGKGVFASRDIKSGERICTMSGKRVSSKQLGFESDRKRNLLVDPFQIGADAYLMLEEPYLLINHSCSPNAGLKNGVNLTAIKNIKKGEEIFYDYSTTWFDGMECKCGSPNCRKHISNYMTIPPEIRKEYRKLDIIPDFIPKDL
ncbi:MAG TPA: SET domain-containing protein-lysine N-methyltransferase [Candidatus Saccharimonadales bacterium]|nr:SET domain-containing protein-lysine N-methyltransferase [Candidatus Saccharimonadales bacterium]